MKKTGNWYWRMRAKLCLYEFRRSLVKIFEDQLQCWWFRPRGLLHSYTNSSIAFQGDGASLLGLKSGFKMNFVYLRFHDLDDVNDPKMVERWSVDLLQQVAVKLSEVKFVPLNFCCDSRTNLGVSRRCLPSYGPSNSHISLEHHGIEGSKDRVN